MRRYVIDANALLRYLLNGMDNQRVLKLLEQAARNEAKLWISSYNRGEVLYNLAKRIGIDEANRALKLLASVMESVPLDDGAAETAVVLKFHYKLGYGDSIAAELAMRLDATLVTADPDFERLGKRLKCMRLARHRD